MLFLRSLAALASLLVALARADETSVERADQLKAAYLFNFLKFVELPHAAKHQIRVCFIGAPDVHRSFAASTTNKRLGARAVTAAQLPSDASWSGCDLVYLDAAEDVHTLLFSAPGSTALTVSDAEDFTHSGGMIRLFTHDNRLRFDIDMANARAAGLKISSDLLRLASRVVQ